MNQLTAIEEDILKCLVCTEIPDTLNLQRLCLASIGQENGCEQFIQNHYKERGDTPRLFRIPSEQLSLVYRLSIPLSLHVNISHSYETKFRRWESSFPNGTMHLTTREGLNRILEISVKNGISLDLENAYGKIFDVERERRSGLSAPHSWSETKEYRPPFQKDLLMHQFVVCEEKVIGIPYYTKESEVVLEKRDICLEDCYDLTEEETRKTEFRLDAMFSSPNHRGDIVAEKYLPEMLKEREKNKIENWDEEREGKKLISYQIELLRIRGPVLIYDPTWVSKVA